MDPSKAANQTIQPAGALWQRVDLHLHTPGVDSFKCADGVDPLTKDGKETLAAEYATQLVNQGISVCAITDYNGVRIPWFKAVRDAVKDKDVTLLPGAEISFQYGKYGLHILAIFEADVDLEGINRWLAAQDREAAEPLVDGRTHRDIDPKAHVVEILKDIRRHFNCLLIVPHPDQTNGLCKSLQIQEAAQFLTELVPDAIEHCSPSTIERLKSTGELDERVLENLAFVEFSDPKHIDEIGTKTSREKYPRTTYLKLSARDVDALRLALHDPETRLAVGTAPEATHARIRQLEISGSGFLGDMEVAWNDDLNVLIGGRGAGKSAVLETLRYGLDMSAYSDEDSRLELIQHALGSGGKVDVIIERPVGEDQTKAYHVSRIWGESPTVTELLTDKPLDVSPEELFGPTGPPAIFGQREIYAVSGDQGYRLRLLDELIGEEAKARGRAVEAAVKDVRSNAASIIDCEKNLERRDELKQRLETIKHRISVYEEHGVAEKLKKEAELRGDGQRLNNASETGDTVKEKWESIEEEVLRRLRKTKADLEKASSVKKEVLEEVADSTQSLIDQLQRLFNEGESLLLAYLETLTENKTTWQEVMEPLKEELNKVKQEVKSDTLDPDDLLDLNEEKARLTPKIEELDQIENRAKGLRKKRKELLAAVREKRHQEHKLRRERADEIEDLVGDRLELIVEFKGQKEEYKESLRKLLRGSGATSDAIDELIAPDATDGIALAEAIRKGADEVQDKFGLTEAMADRVVAWFEEDEERLFQLETIVPADSLSVNLVIDGVGRPIDRLSPGQRATAILLLLFALEGRPLILDQPEDDLDNKFVYEDIVQLLRAQKGLREEEKSRRQIIAATHNPNIPVIGDAELVLALEGTQRGAKVVSRASIDDSTVREHIKLIMEGGEEAFRRRQEKYGGVIAFEG